MKIAVIFCLILLTYGCKKGDSTNSDTATKNDSIAPKILTAKDTAEVQKSVDSEMRAIGVGGLLGLGWDYDSTYDEMRNITTHFARTWSVNKIQTDRYSSELSAVEMNLRKRGKGSPDVYLNIPGGQFLTSVEGTSISVKFDNNPIQHFDGEEPDDGSSNVMFVDPTSKFISMLRKAKNVTIEAPFFEAGRQQFQFNVEGLIWQ